MKDISLYWVSRVSKYSSGIYLKIWQTAKTMILWSKNLHFDCSFVKYKERKLFSALSLEFSKNLEKLQKMTKLYKLKYCILIVYMSSNTWNYFPATASDSGESYSSSKPWYESMPWWFTFGIFLSLWKNHKKEMWRKDWNFHCRYVK